CAIRVATCRRQTPRARATGTAASARPGARRRTAAGRSRNAVPFTCARSTSRSAWRPRLLMFCCFTALRVSSPRIARLIATEASTAAAVTRNRRRRRDVTRSSRRDRLVAGTAHGADQVGTPELAPKLGDVDVDRAGPPRECPAPDPVDQLLAR